MTVPTITDDQVAELEKYCGLSKRDCEVLDIGYGELRALLAERAELKRDAERYRLFAATVVAECSGADMTAQQRALFGCMNSVVNVSLEELGAMFDSAMQEKPS